MSELKSTKEATSTEEIKPQISKLIATDKLASPEVKELNRNSVNISLDEEEYKDNIQYTGLVVIFNQIHFEDPKYEERKSAVLDTSALKDCLEKLNFKIYTHINLKKKQIFEELKKLAATNHSNYKCFILVIMTHGGRDGVLLASNDQFKDYEIWENFTGQNCPTLKYKPKFFIFQASKRFPDEPRRIAGSDIVSKSSSTNLLEKDMLVAYSTMEGDVSCDEALVGSVFIQALCKNINNCGATEDVLTILMKTVACVFNHKNKDCTIPVVSSTLNKKFYLIEGKEEPPNLRYF